MVDCQPFWRRRLASQMRQYPCAAWVRGCDSRGLSFIRGAIGLPQPLQVAGGVKRFWAPTWGVFTPAMMASWVAVSWSPLHHTPACMTPAAGDVWTLSSVSPAVSASSAHCFRIGQCVHISIASNVRGSIGWGLVKTVWPWQGGLVCFTHCYVTHLLLFCVTLFCDDFEPHFCRFSLDCGLYGGHDFGHVVGCIVWDYASVCNAVA